jgi:hypothetical protein
LAIGLFVFNENRPVAADQGFTLFGGKFGCHTGILVGCEIVSQRGLTRVSRSGVIVFVSFARGKQGGFETIIRSADGDYCFCIARAQKSWGVLKQ